jgi:predicted esterase
VEKVNPDEWISFLPEESRASADQVPVQLRRWIDKDVGPLLTPDIIARFTPEMQDWPAAKAWRQLFKPTAFQSIRMEAEVGGICAISTPKHPRFPYFSYVPMRAQLAGVTRAPILLTVHGSERNAYASRDRFAAFAEATGCFVLAPLFPMSMADANPDEQYKYVFTEAVRFDLVALDLIADFSAHVGVEFDQLLLHGYSGGGQFVNRFLYLHADRVAAASIGAPGYVTLPTFERRWWTGLDGLEAIIGEKPDLDRLARVPLHLMIGALDDFEIDNYAPAEMGLTDEQYRDYGLTRRQRLDRLCDAYRALGATVSYDIVPDMAHGTRVEPAVKFFTDFLSSQEQQHG